MSERIYLLRVDRDYGKHWHIADGTSWDSSPMVGRHTRAFELAGIDREKQGVLVWCLNKRGERMAYIAQKMADDRLKNCKPRKVLARGTYAELWPQLLQHGEML